jgi:predicted RNA-binding protein YlxR (DUF448 family)
MGKGKSHVPVRTCVSCGAKKSKAELIRFVLDPGGGGLLQDKERRLQGRGAYACGTEACLDALRNSKKIGKALRRHSRSH